MSIDSMMMDVDAGGSDFEMSDEPPPKKGRAKAAPKKTAAAAKKAPARGKAKAKIVSEDDDDEEDEDEIEEEPAPPKRTNRAAVLRCVRCYSVTHEPVSEQFFVALVSTLL